MSVTQDPLSRLDPGLFRDLEKAFDGPLYAILGLPSHASPLAVYRELGWTGLAACSASAKIVMYDQVISLGMGHPARRLLVARMGA